MENDIETAVQIATETWLFCICVVWKRNGECDILEQIGAELPLTRPSPAGEGDDCLENSAPTTANPNHP